MNESNYYPSRYRILRQKLGRGAWICRVYDFFGQLVFTGRGRTRSETDRACCTVRDEHKAQDRVSAARVKIPKGEHWRVRLCFSDKR